MVKTQTFLVFDFSLFFFLFFGGMGRRMEIQLTPARTSKKRTGAFLISGQDCVLPTMKHNQPARDPGS